jgi:hypothetical protein
MTVLTYRQVHGPREPRPAKATVHCGACSSSQVTTAREFIATTDGAQPAEWVTPELTRDGDRLACPACGASFDRLNITVLARDARGSVLAFKSATEAAQTAGRLMVQWAASDDRRVRELTVRLRSRERVTVVIAR